MRNYDCCQNCRFGRYSQFAPAGEICCKFKKLGFVKLSDVCDRYEREEQEPENEEE